MDEILINKMTTIERCIRRIHDDYQSDFRENFTKQDAVILNIERSCQSVIDMGNRYIRIKNLGIPQSNRDTFVKLEKNGIINEDLSTNLQAMAGFRNLAVHDYSAMNIEIVIDIVENQLIRLIEFAELIIDKMDE